jgi:site-specific DNA-methyltransferase (adenine-specific)
MMELNKIYCGDNCDLLGELPRECIDLVVTSPPYDDLRTYGGHTWDFYGVAWQLKRVLKPGGVIVWVVGDATVNGSETSSSMEQALFFRRLGLNMHDTMIYDKGFTPCYDPRNKRYKHRFEFMFVFSKGTPATYNPIIDEPVKNSGVKLGSTSRKPNGDIREYGAITMGDKQARGNIWTIDNGYMRSTTDKEAYDHPAIFPEQLPKDHILSWSNPGDLVLDPFTGSGTTCKAAKELGRNFLGFEINPEYCKIAERRIAQEVLDFAS